MDKVKMKELTLTCVFDIVDLNESIKKWVFNYNFIK